jgi:hypothetical protein
MAFHTNDNEPIITLSNYEEYFLMYVDNELTPAERGLVEAFVQFHPELQAELDLLMGTRLDPEMVPFGDKENLLAQNIQTQVTDENLLLYVDGELAGKAEEEITEKLQKDETYLQAYQWLLRTKSNPAEVVPYPDKEELYRRTVRRIGLPFALRIAAAVLLLASMSVLYLQQNDTTTASVAAIPKKPIEQKEPGGADNATVQAAPVNEPGNERKEGEVVIQPAPAPLIAAAQPERTAKKKQTTAILKTPISTKAIKTQEEAPAVAYEPAPLERERMTELRTIESVKKDFEPSVTYNAPQPYIISDATAKADFAAEKEDDGRNKGNLKSLLRKATRMVERRTGIDATNEDDELLIGVVALKLK